METTIKLTALARDTLTGLSANQKYLLPRYFYDDEGSRIFQDIMNMQEYYLTNCETEIFENHKQALARAFSADGSDFDLIELGSGDGSKTKILLKELSRNDGRFHFIPIDISAEANALLLDDLLNELPHLSVQAQTGDYFDIMHALYEQASKRKVILFLGSNIGNFSDAETDDFLNHLNKLSNPGDQVLIGFDLKKSPQILLPAYDDPHGYTRRFNLNLLQRLNRELGADFDTGQFMHHADYNPQSGEMSSYLISTISQTVHIEALESDFHFERWEAIFMERSRKYDIAGIENLAGRNGFEVKQHFFDRQNYFTDSLWIKK